MYSGPGQQAIANSGFLGGLQAGWNYQVQRLVLGTEVDFSWTRLNGTNSAALLSKNPNVSDTETDGNTTNWIGSATTRLGIARDTLLLYGKAGAAWANNSYSLNHAGVYYGLSPPLGFAATTNDTRVGWTVGTGLEWAFARNWTAKIEYDYMDFGTATENFAGTVVCVTFACPAPANIAVNVKETISEVKLGINYKFDPGFLFW